MLISKKSRRPSAQFESRFRGGPGSAFPLRQYLRAREDFTSGLVHLLLLAAFGVLLVLFARTVDQLFVVHGPQLNPWWRRAMLLLMGVFVLSVLRRLYYKVKDLREIRREMKQLKNEFRQPAEAAPPDCGPGH